jgi:beta-glucosidase
MVSRQSNLPIPERISALLGEMTLDEKLAQLYSYWIFDLQNSDQGLSCEKMKALLSNGIGQITRAGGASALNPKSLAKTINSIQHFLINETRLSVPAIIHEECCSGYMMLGATVFPQMIGLASTFHPELAFQMTEVIRRQMRAVGAHQGLAPVLDVARDARWGRVEETFGEDPLLVSQFGVAYIRGLQGESLANGGVIATGKHFIGHSSSQGGQNCAPAHMGKRDIWDILVPPFEAAIRDGGLHSMMNSYPEIDGEVVAASRAILTDMLRKQLGFEGLIVSDYDAILMIQSYHRAANNRSEAAALALNAGIQVELPAAACYADALKQAIKTGKASLEQVDEAVVAHLRMKFELGLFENPYTNEDTVVDVFESAGQRALALDIAGQSLVLLTNDGVLPLKKTIRKLAVIGPNADSRRNLLGDYSYASMLDYMQSIATDDSALKNVEREALDAYAVKIPTILECLAEAAPQTEILYTQGCAILGEDRSGFDEAVRLAKEADAIVLVLGDRSGLLPDCSTGETRDSVDLRLPGVQNELALAVIETGKPVVIVLVNGRPLAIPEITASAGAILEAWLPGEEGGQAIVAALFGDLNPGGKLPITFPRHVGQVPVYYNQKPSGGKSYWYTHYVNADSSPLFSFGHGLSYTTFDYSNFSISCQECKAGETVHIGVTIKNSGETAGEEVVQLYICDDIASMPRPVKELKGFVRLSLQAGESRRVMFHLQVDLLAFYDQNMQLIVENGVMKVLIGSSSKDIRCQGAFSITGEEKSLVAKRIYECPVVVN